MSFPSTICTALAKRRILSVAFSGRFSIGLLALEKPQDLAHKAGLTVADTVSPEVDLLVIAGDRVANAKGATATKVERLRRAGHRVQMMLEPDFLNLIELRYTKQHKMDLAALIVRLRTISEEGYIERALTLLKQQKFEIYAEVRTTEVCGIVKSYGEHASWISSTGDYHCRSTGLHSCGGSRYRVCKHILTVLIALVHKGDLSAESALAWVTAAQRKLPTLDEEETTVLFLNYKNQAASMDWRPDEVIPEDYIFA